MIIIDEEQQLKDKALAIGERYKESDKPKKIEVGQLMIGNRKPFYKRKTRKNKR